MTGNKIITTDDKSNSVYSSQFNQTYHSERGAVNEALHVFINAGLLGLDCENVNVFEVGFGSGLNAFLTLIEAEKNQRHIIYNTIEKFPIHTDIVNSINYPLLYKEYSKYFYLLHSSDFDVDTKLTNNFIFNKTCADFTEFSFSKKYDLIYFDAFSFDSQPEMWSIDIFTKIFASMNPDGILVTYSSKGTVKQNLRTAGFTVKRLPGYMKRHILTASK